MATWKEAREAKVSRQHRERRYFTPDKLGRPCPVCKSKVPKALNEAGIPAHPTCGPSELTTLRARTPVGAGDLDPRPLSPAQGAAS